MNRRSIITGLLGLLGLPALATAALARAAAPPEAFATEITGEAIGNMTISASSIRVVSPEKVLVQAFVTPKYPEISYHGHPGFVQILQGGKIVYTAAISFTASVFEGRTVHKPQATTIVATLDAGKGEATINLIGSLRGEFETELHETPLTR